MHVIVINQTIKGNAAINIADIIYDNQYGTLFAPFLFCPWVN
jgi:hypothetical protein